MPLSGRGGFPTDSHQIGPVSRGQDSFAGVREYRRGDSMRHIHWRASARRGEWIVREYEQIENVELIVVLDAQPEANVGRGRESCFEYAVRIAASLAQFAIDNGHRVGVFCLQPSGARWLAPDSGWHHYRHLLEYLSEVEADCRLPYLQAVEQAAALAGRQGRLLLFHTVETPGDMPATPLPSQRIDQRPMQVLFDAGSFRHPPGTDPDRRSGPIGDSLYWVQSGANLSEVFGR
nr:DUF58 domain-containing protein [Marinobacterium ramblicola]